MVLNINEHIVDHDMFHVDCLNWGLKRSEKVIPAGNYENRKNTTLKFNSLQQVFPRVRTFLRGNLVK